MNQFTLELRDALVGLGVEGITLEAKEPEFVEFAGKQLKPGRYGRAKGYAKAFLIVDSNGTTYYQNKHGEVSKRLTPKAFLTHWDAGMSTYLGEI
jgi:hypothetical protein